MPDTIERRGDRSVVLIAFVALALLLLPGCDLIGDLLAFGFWSGVVVVALILLVIWLGVRFFRK